MVFFFLQFQTGDYLSGHQKFDDFGKKLLIPGSADDHLEGIVEQNLSAHKLNLMASLKV